MGYIVYHILSKRSVGWNRTERGAKISCAAWNRRSGASNYAIMEEDAFNSVYNKQVIVKNLMTGEDVYINAQEKGTIEDPSTERYWSF